MATGEGPRASRPRRRTFTADYKMRILAQYEQLDDPRERGALLRREGLYTSHISEWRKARDKGAEKGLAEKPAGRPGRSAADAENERLRKENEKLATSWRGRRPRWTSWEKHLRFWIVLRIAADGEYAPVMSCLSAVLGGRPVSWPFTVLGLPAGAGPGCSGWCRRGS